MRYINALIVLLLNMFLSLPALAGSIVAELDRNEVALGEAVQLMVTVSGSLKGELTLSGVDGLDFRESGTSTSVQIINGSMSKETGYSYHVIPQKEGTFTIPSIKAKIDGEDVATAPITLKVVAGAAGVPQNPSAGSGKGATDNQGQQALPVFIERELSASQLYEGQPVASTIKIYQNIREVQKIPDRPSNPDWRVITTEQQKSYTTERDGATWLVTELKEVLIPLKAGELDLPRFSLNVTYVVRTKRQRRSGTIWDMLQNGMFDSGEQVTKSVSSAAKKIKVKPIPQEGKPPIDSDIVGDFKAEVNVSKRTLEEGETATVTVKISGQGALDRMVDIKLPPMIGAKVYDDKPVLEESLTESGLSSTKTYKFALVPSKAGTLDLGVLELGIFDPWKTQWKHIKESMGSIQVGSNIAGASGTETSQAAPQTNHNQESKAVDNKNEVTSNQQVSESKAGIEMKPETGLQDGSIQKKTWYFIAMMGLLVSGILFFGIWIAKKLSSKSKKKSNKPFLSLAKIGTSISNKTPGSIENLKLELTKILTDSTAASSSLTTDEIVMHLVNLNVANEVIVKVKSALLEWDREFYSDQAISSETFEKVSHAVGLLVMSEAKYAVK